MRAFVKRPKPKQRETPLDYPMSGKCNQCRDFSELSYGLCAECRGLKEVLKEVLKEALEEVDERARLAGVGA